MVTPLEYPKGSVSQRMEMNLTERSFIRLQALLVICLAWPSTVRTQRGPPGYVSIDCGSDVEYYDNVTGIYWETDANYVRTGRNENINVVTKSVTYDSPIQNGRQCLTARAFRESRTRDCYVLPVNSSTTYLVRATFYFGNLTDVAVIIFGLYMDNSLLNFLAWDAGSSPYTVRTTEVMYSPTRETLNLCLVSVTGSVTFISALELRPLTPGMYSNVVGPSDLALYSGGRYNCGRGPNTSVTLWRHPDDDYDRIWTIPVAPNADVKSITNSSISRWPDALAQYPELPPLAVMADGWFVDGTDTLVFPFFDVEPPLDLHVNLYFQELDGNTSANGVRGMDFFWNNEFIGSFNVTEKPLAVNVTRTVTANSLNISFTKAAWASSGPILNAVELFQVFTYNRSRTTPGDVSAIRSLQERFDLTDWTGDPCLPVPFAWLACNDEEPLRVTSLNIANFGLGGPIPEAISNLTALTDLTLNNDSLEGPIPDWSGLVHLRTISLQYNSLTGGIPDFFISVFPNLTELHLDYNDLSGPVPSALLAKPGLVFTYSNNRGLITPTSKKTSIGAVVGGILGGLVGLAILGTIMYMCLTRKRRARAKILKAMGRAAANPGDGWLNDEIIRSLPGSMTILTLEDLSRVTKKFVTKIGEGAFGPVYYGKLPDGREVAVKVKSSDSRQGAQEFFNEVELLSRIHHRNLVSLVGFCEDQNQQALVYVYVSNGTLRDHLYGNKSTKVLDWITRLDIALNAARGLEYLHTDCQPRIIHRDVKSSNILIDENMVAKVADFGISKQAPEGHFTSVDTLLKGTFGYMDPEYFQSQRLTQKSDVYSFGVVLLEIISGRHPYFAELPDGTSGTLIQWVRSAVRYESKLDVVDTSLKGEFTQESMAKVIDLAMSCIHLRTVSRPEMSQVARILAEAIELELFSNTTLDSNRLTKQPSIIGSSGTVDHSSGVW